MLLSRARSVLTLAFVTAASLILAAGCVEISNILSPEAPVEEPDWDTFFADQDNGDEPADTDNDADAIDDVDTNAIDDDDVDTNAVDDMDTNSAADDDATEGIPPLPDDAVVETTATGLQFYDFVLGAGELPDPTGSVRVAYTGYLPDGTIFDSSDSVVFNLGGLIAGFSEGVTGMQVGGRRRLIIPPDLGYGASGNAGAGIGGEDTIIFDVELLSIE